MFRQLATVAVILTRRKECNISINPAGTGVGLVLCSCHLGGRTIVSQAGPLGGGGHTTVSQDDHIVDHTTVSQYD